MHRFLCELTPELVQALDEAAGDRSRNAAIEEWLWRIGEVKDAAKKLKISKPTRRKRGRPRKDEA